MVGWEKYKLFDPPFVYPSRDGYNLEPLMIKLRILAIICLSVFIGQSNAQPDSLLLKKLSKEFRLKTTLKAPTILMGASLLARADAEVIGWENVYVERNENISTFRSNLDDYLQYSPLAGVIALNALGIKGENNFPKQMWLAKAELLMAAIVCPLKKISVLFIYPQDNP